MQNIINPNNLHTDKVEDLVEKLKSGASILETLNAKGLRREMTLIGLICRFFLYLASVKHNVRRTRMRICKLLGFFFPYTIQENNYSKHSSSEISQRALVLFFNHQSLFEVLATIHWTLANFDNKRCLFPVNLPWFEALAPIHSELFLLGIEITPMITPSTYQKLTTKKNADKELITDLKRKFELHYARAVGQYALDRNIIAVAPSATRTKTIFPSYEAYHGDKEALESIPKVMSTIIAFIRRATNSINHAIKIDFVPFVVIPKNKVGRRLNLFCPHRIYIGEALTFPEAEKLYKLKKIDFTVNSILANFAPQYLKFPQKAAV